MEMQLRINLLDADPDLESLLSEVFGEEGDPIDVVDIRAQKRLAQIPHIVWEGDAETFRFSYVSRSSETILGHPARAWIENPTFWTDCILYPDDAKDAVAFCALATGQGKDHDFVYRALTRDRRIVRLHDVVRVVKGIRGIPVRLRGIMLVIPDDQSSPGSPPTASPA